MDLGAPKEPSLLIKTETIEKYIQEWGRWDQNIMSNIEKSIRKLWLGIARRNYFFAFNWTILQNISHNSSLSCQTFHKIHFVYFLLVPGYNMWAQKLLSHSHQFLPSMGSNAEVVKPWIFTVMEVSSWRYEAPLS